MKFAEKRTAEKPNHKGKMSVRKVQLVLPGHCGGGEAGGVEGRPPVDVQQRGVSPGREEGLEDSGVAHHGGSVQRAHPPLG
jgi:hypothetical protein